MTDENYLTLAIKCSPTVISFQDKDKKPGALLSIELCPSVMKFMKVIERLRLLWKQKKYKELVNTYQMGQSFLTEQNRRQIQQAINTIPVEVYAADVLDWIVTPLDESERTESIGVSPKVCRRENSTLFPDTNPKTNPVYKEKKDRRRF